MFVSWLMFGAPTGHTNKNALCHGPLAVELTTSVLKHLHPRESMPEVVEKRLGKLATFTAVGFS